MGKGSILLLFTVAAATCLLMGNLPAATMSIATSGTWLPEVNTCETTVAADQVQLQAVRIEEDIGMAANNDVLAVVGQDEVAQKMTMQNEINVKSTSTGSGAFFHHTYA